MKESTVERMRAKFPHSILLYPVGEHWEAYNADATILSNVCGAKVESVNDGSFITLRASFPDKSLDEVIKKLSATNAQVLTIY